MVSDYHINNARGNGISLDAIGIKYGTDKSSIGHDILRHYEEFFSSIRNEKFNLIEIGGYKGASLSVWKDFFPNAQVVCLDIDPKVRQYVPEGVRFHLGDASDKNFISEIKNIYGTARVIIDDGSHRWDHQRIALESFFDFVEPGGFYIIEAMHTSYEPGFSGNDVIPFSTYLNIYTEYLNARGKKREEFKYKYPKIISDIGENIDCIQHAQRFSIIKRKKVFEIERINYNSFCNKVNDLDLLKCSPVSARWCVPNIDPLPVKPPVIYGEYQTHALSDASKNCHEIGISKLEYAVCVPKQIILSSDLNYIYEDSFRRYNAAPHSLLEKRGDKFIPNVPVKPTKYLSGSTFYFDGEHAGHFGHYLLELIPRLWASEFIDIKSMRILMGHTIPKSFDIFLEAFGIKAENIERISSPVLCETLYVSKQSYALENYATTYAFKTWNKIGSYFDDHKKRGPVYISRAKFLKQRILENEADVEKIFSDRGFEIVHPQELTIPEQVRIFRNSSLIAGPSGSALYNTVFAENPTPRFILVSDKFLIPNDSLIAAGTGADVTYFIGRALTSDVGMSAEWTIDIDGLSLAIDNWLVRFGA